MTLFNGFTILLILSSVVVTEADDDGAWKREMEQKMEEVLRVVQRQEDMILKRDRVIDIQGRNIEKHSEEIGKLKDMILKRDRVIELQSRNIEKHNEEIGMLKRSMKEKTLQHIVQHAESKVDNATHKTTNEQPQGVQRRFLDGSPGHQTPVAFYAYISKDFTHVGDNHMFVFDTIVTNSGHAYNNYSGVFTASSSGLYAFAYSIAVAGHHISGDTDSQYGEISVQLVRNATPYGSIAADTERASDDEMATGFAILYLDAGDIVKVTAKGQGQGSFLSSRYEHWSFSGFKIQ